MKISIIGMGKVGTAIAFGLTLRSTPQTLVLVGKNRENVLGEVYDLQHTAVFGKPMEISAGEVRDTWNSDVVIICASAPYRLGITRLDLLDDNAVIFRDLIPQVTQASPDAILIVVSNPVDVMTHLALRLSKFSPGKVIGTGTLVDTGRFRARLSELWQINASDVRAYILGEHGESQFPALSAASFGGVKLDHTDADVLAAADEAKNAGHQILRQKGYSNFAIAAATLMIVEAIANNARSVMPVSTLVEHFHGVSDVCLSMPAIIGKEGIARVLPINLNESEIQQLRASAKLLREASARVE